MKKLIALIVAGACLGGLSAKEFYVSHLKDADGNPYYEGAPKGTKIYENLGELLVYWDCYSCTVWVEDGYVCNSGDEDSSGHSRLNLKGNNVILRSRSGDWRKGVTVIGQYATGVDTGYGADAIRGMVVNGSNSKIIGFKFLNGATRLGSYAGEASSCGGGAHVVQNGGATFSNCCFSACKAKHNGGGVCGKDGNRYYGCFFENCKAANSGSGFLSGQAYDCVFTNMSGLVMNGPTVVSNCTVTASSAAVSISKDAIIADCWFTNNLGRGISVSEGKAQVFRTVVANNTAAGSGAGVYAVNAGGIYGEDLTITNNVSTSGGGAGAYNAVLVRSDLIGNRAVSPSYNNGYGGGAYGGILSNCVVACNYAGKGTGTFDSLNCGGGTYNTQCIGCVVSNNASGYRGGGICFDGNNLEIENYNNIIVNNDLGGWNGGAAGGGAYGGRHFNSLIANNTTVSGAALDCKLAVNCTVTGNTTANTIFRGGIDAPKIINTISWGNTPASDQIKTSASNSCFKAAASFPNAGNIAVNPKFKEVGGLAYYPGAAKCRNSGLKFDWMEDPADPRAKDVYGNARIQGSAPDMGAAECASLGLMLLFR